jgi:hypothetical protein
MATENREALYPDFGLYHSVSPDEPPVAPNEGEAGSSLSREDDGSYVVASLQASASEYGKFASAKLLTSESQNSLGFLNDEYPHQSNVSYPVHGPENGESGLDGLHQPTSSRQVKRKEHLSVYVSQSSAPWPLPDYEPSGFAAIQPVFGALESLEDYFNGPVSPKVSELEVAPPSISLSELLGYPSADAYSHASSIANLRGEGIRSGQVDERTSQANVVVSAQRPTALVRPMHTANKTQIVKVDYSRQKQLRGNTQNGIGKRKPPYHRNQPYLFERSMVNTKHASDESLAGYYIVFGAPQSQRGTMSIANKAQTARRRKAGACLVCVSLKRKCKSTSDFLPCTRCFERSPEVTCRLMVDIADIVLLRCFEGTDIPENPMNFNHYVGNWPSSIDDGTVTGTSRWVTITQGVGQLKIDVEVEIFRPRDVDSVGYSGTDSEGPYQLDKPPCCLVHWQAVHKAAVRYAMAALALYLREMYCRPEDRLLGASLFVAYKLGDPLVYKCLLLWAGSRVMERIWTFCGGNTLGVPPFRTARDPWQGTVPVTPIMDQQLDEIFLNKILKPLRDEIRVELKRRLTINESVAKERTTIFFVVLILLNSLEMMNRHDNNFARRYGFGGRFWGVSKRRYPLWDVRNHSAKILLAHFHNTCGPLSRWIEHARHPNTHKGLHKTHLYFQRLQQEFTEGELEFRQLADHHAYEANFYWVHQMFYSGWKPGRDHVVEIDIM